MSQSELVVRPYAEADEAVVIQLWREAFPDNPPWNRRRPTSNAN